MLKNKNKLIALSLMSIFIITSGFGCKLVSQETKKAMEPISLTYWGVWDSPDAYEDIIAAYKQIHPFVNIEYKKFRYSEYETELLNALAEDRGPDIFSIHNTWVRKYQSKIQPMPDQITMAYPVVKGTLKKETVPELRTNKTISLKEIKNNFVDAVYNDVIIKVMDEKTKISGEKVFGLPLSVDTLALYYNKDLINNAGISQPPIYWNKEFQQDVKKLTRQDAKGQIEQAGAALGGSANITRYSDILSVLMMQNGAEMMDESNHVLFGRIPSNYKDQKYNPGLEALRFYTDFANPSREVYSWNKDMENSLDLFTKGRLAFLLGYSYFLPDIKAQAPKMNYGITKLPQIEGNTQTINFANYWVETVSSKSKHKDEAWDFIQFMTKDEQVKSYLDKTKKPTALRSLINEQIDDQEIGVFAEQVLTAKSWYRGNDPMAMERIMGELIEGVVAGRDKIENLLSLAVRQVQQTIQSD